LNGQRYSEKKPPRREPSHRDGCKKLSALVCPKVLRPDDCGIAVAKIYGFVI
jgi:hypothetical protein